MTLSEALEFAEKCKKEGNISTSAKAVIALYEEYKKYRSKIGALDNWLNSEPGWYVKDYTDGWIFFDNVDDARTCSVDMGDSLIREVKDGVCKQI